ncbi:hypothetical protein HpBTM60_34780 [Helicobacter pylori]
MLNQKNNILKRKIEVKFLYTKGIRELMTLNKVRGIYIPTWSKTYY